MYNHKSLQNPKRKKLKATKEKRQITRKELWKIKLLWLVSLKKKKKKTHRKNAIIHSKC